MGNLDLFGRQRRKKNKMLLKEFDKGKLLQVDNGINNKDYLKEVEEENEFNPKEKGKNN